MVRRCTSILLTLLIGALSISSAAAQSPEVKAARETVERVAAPEETIESRQQALVSILDLTAAEIADVTGEKKLGAVIKHADAVLAGSALQVRLTLLQYQSYVQLVRAQVSKDGQTIEALKEIAAGFKDWREQVYGPVVRHALDTILVAQGAEIIATAQRRLERVSSDVKKIQTIKKAAANELITLFESARDHVAAATRHHEQSRDLLTGEYEDFLALLVAQLPGGPETGMLRRGATGDFVCSPTAAVGKSSACEIAFKRSLGGHIVLKNADGTPFVYAAGDLAQVSGTLLILSPLFADDVIVGTFFVTAVNRIELPPTPAAFSTPAEFEAAVLETVIKKQSIQALTKHVLDEIQLAYKDFFAMSKKAQQLLAR